MKGTPGLYQLLCYKCPSYNKEDQKESLFREAHFTSITKNIRILTYFVEHISERRKFKGKSQLKLRWPGPNEIVLKILEKYVYILLFVFHIGRGRVEG